MNPNNLDNNNNTPPQMIYGHNQLAETKNTKKTYLVVFSLLCLFVGGAIWGFTNQNSDSDTLAKDSTAEKSTGYQTKQTDKNKEKAGTNLTASQDEPAAATQEQSPSSSAETEKLATAVPIPAGVAPIQVPPPNITQPAPENVKSEYVKVCTETSNKPDNCGCEIDWIEKRYTPDQIRSTISNRGSEAYANMVLGPYYDYSCKLS